MSMNEVSVSVIREGPGRGGGGREREGARMNFHPKSMRRTGD